MPEDAESQPVKRGPGRPRKVAAVPPVETQPPDDAWKTPEPAKFPPDERIGTQIADTACTSISYSDGDRQYRVENGVIVERVR